MYIFNEALRDTYEVLILSERNIFVISVIPSYSISSLDAVQSVKF